MGQRSLALSPQTDALERIDLRTWTSRVWQYAPDRFYFVTRMWTHCFGENLERVIDYTLRQSKGMLAPRSSPFDVRVSRAGEHVEIAGANMRLLDFGMMKGGWQGLLPITPSKLKVTPRFAPYRFAPTYHASYLDGELSPGVKFHAAVSVKGYGKELRFARAVQTHWFSKLSDAEFFGLRYRMDGELAPDWLMKPPVMFVRRRGGSAEGFYRREGQYLYVLWARKELDKLLPGEWIVDPAITQESVAANSDDCYESGAGNNNLNGYAGRDYWGAYSGNPHAGLRFQTIPIPDTATGMNSSTIQVYREVLTGAPSCTIYADDRADAPTWVTGNQAEKPNGANFTRTTANAVWNSSFGSNNAYVSTPSLAPVVFEVVDRPDWASGNDIRFAFIGGGTGSNFFAWNDFSSNSTTEEAVFDGDYADGGGGGGSTPRNNLGLLGVGR